MEKRKITSLDAEVSLLGFGLMRLPVIDNDKAKIDYPTAEKMLNMAFEGGINYFDTAYPYHEGKSEIFVGDVLSRRDRSGYYLASKMPTWETAKSEDEVKRIFDEQLKKCKTDYFDFYLAHSFDYDHFERFKRLHMYDFLKKKKEEGYIKRLGFSFHSDPDLLAQVVEGYEWEFAQIQLNYVDWDLLNARRFYEYLTAHKLPVIVMEPVRGGALASLNEKAAGILKTARPRDSLASWAIRFAASLPKVMTVLSGMSTPEQMEDNLKTFNPSFTPLSDDERKILDQAARAYNASGTIPCTGCRYCMDCPSGVDIPTVFRQYNHYQVSKKRDVFDNTYRYLPEREKAHHCISCGACVKLCPQGIDIPKFMKEIALFAGEK
ncbi:MAG: aldo/keto reductase [Treponema sp.]|jgi:predicted aldo/keto reductase-like oxidoreductase|nr:aldo/keto reductase [Treponema sp.]